MNNKLESTQKALKQLRAVFENQKIEVILNKISSQQEELVNVVSNMAKKGRSERKTQQKLQSIVHDLNKCNNELPETYKEISDGLERAIKEMQKALDPELVDVKSQRDHLLDADFFLKNCIHGLKDAVAKNLDHTINEIARANK